MIWRLFPSTTTCSRTARRTFCRPSKSRASRLPPTSCGSSPGQPGHPGCGGFAGAGSQGLLPFFQRFFLGFDNPRPLLQGIHFDHACLVGVEEAVFLLLQFAYLGVYPALFFVRRVRRPVPGQPALVLTLYHFGIPEQVCNSIPNQGLGFIRFNLRSPADLFIPGDYAVVTGAAVDALAMEVLPA